MMDANPGRADVGSAEKIAIDQDTKCSCRGMAGKLQPLYELMLAPGVRETGQRRRRSRRSRASAKANWARCGGRPGSGRGRLAAVSSACKIPAYASSLRRTRKCGVANSTSVQTVATLDLHGTSAAA